MDSMVNFSFRVFPTAHGSWLVFMDNTVNLAMKGSAILSINTMDDTDIFCVATRDLRRSEDCLPVQASNAEGRSILFEDRVT